LVFAEAGMVPPSALEELIAKVKELDLSELTAAPESPGRSAGAPVADGDPDRA
jgi:hypothetical protein